MNSLDKLSQLQGTSPSQSHSERSSGARRIPAAALPLGLLLAFVVVFAVLFGARLLPAAEVQTAPVITLRAAGPQGATDSPDAPAPNGSEEKPEPDKPAEPAPVPANQPLLFQASGWVEPDPYVTHAPTLINGIVREVHVLDGQSVERGQLLATLVDEDARLDLEEARQRVASLNAKNVAHCAELPVLNAQMHGAEQRIEAEEALLTEMRDISRRLDTAKAGSVSERDVIQARLKVERQAATVDEVKAEMPRLLAMINKVDLERIAVESQIQEARTDLARKQLAFDRTRIHSPIDGIVLHLHVSPGKKRMLNMDDPKSATIVELYQPDKLQARIDVPLSEAAAVAIHQPVRLSTDLLPDTTFHGVVTRIVGEADLQRNTLQVKVRIINPDPRLRPEMLVRAEFFPGRAQSSTQPGRPGPATAASERLALYAPEEALFDRDGSRARAWIVDDGQARLRDLTLGTAEREAHLLVTDGLRPGDKLILPPHDRIKNGARIRVAAR